MARISDSHAVHQPASTFPLLPCSAVLGDAGGQTTRGYATFNALPVGTHQWQTHSRTRAGGSGRLWPGASPRLAAAPFDGGWARQHLPGLPDVCRAQKRPFSDIPVPSSLTPQHAWCPAPVVPRSPCSLGLDISPQLCLWKILPGALRSPLGEGTSAAQELQVAWGPEGWPAAQLPTWPERASSWGAG